MLILSVTVNNPDALLDASAFGVGALIRLESSATESGVYTEVATEAIVAGLELYSITDPAGTSSTWYRSRYSTAVPAGATDYSEYSAAFRPGVVDAYASLEMFRAYVRNQTTLATDEDAAIAQIALESAARAIDRATGRTFQLATTASARVFTAGISTGAVGWPLYTRRYAVDVDGFFDTTSLAVAFDASGNGSYTTACTTFRVGPVNAPATGKPYTSLLFDIGTMPPLWEQGVEVTAKWGWNVVPAPIVNANLIQAARFLKRRDSPFGIAGSPEMGNELRLLARLDPDVALLIQDYKLDWGFA